MMEIVPNRKVSSRILAVAALFLSAGGATAREDDLEPQVEAPKVEAAKPTFDVGFGIAVTTDYVSRAITQSDSDPAIQGYIEPTYGIGYVNIWSSNVDFGEDFRGAEIDVAAGLRPQFGPLSLNFGYVHYFYAPDSVSPDYGEIFAKADYNFNDKLTLRALVFYAPDFSQTGNSATFIAAGAKVPLPNDFAVYGGVGYQFFEDKAAFEDLAWTAGLSYTWKQITFDLRYWDTNLSNSECVVRSGFDDGCDARVVATISFDTTISALRNRASDSLK